MASYPPEMDSRRAPASLTFGATAIASATSKLSKLKAMYRRKKPVGRLVNLETFSTESESPQEFAAQGLLAHLQTDSILLLFPSIVDCSKSVLTNP